MATVEQHLDGIENALATCAADVFETLFHETLNLLADASCRFNYGSRIPDEDKERAPDTLDKLLTAYDEFWLTL